MSDALFHLLTRAAGIEVAFAESQARRYEQQSSDDTQSPDPAHAEFLFKLQREDSTHTDDKTKQLLALSSSLATVLLAFARDVRPRWMVVVILALLVCAVFLCLSVLGVRREQLPDPGDTKDVNGADTWARNLSQAKGFNIAAHRFRVDRYRAAARYFRLALLLTPFAAVFTVARPDPATRVETAIGGIAKELSALRSSVESLPPRLSRTRRVDAAAVPPISGIGPSTGGKIAPKLPRPRSAHRDSTD